MAAVSGWLIATAVFAGIGAGASIYSAQKTSDYYSDVAAMSSEQQANMKAFWEEQLTEIDPAIEATEALGSELKNVEDALYAPQEEQLQMATGQTLEQIYSEGESQKVKTDFAHSGNIENRMDDISQDVIKKSETESYKSINELRRKKLELDLDTMEDVATLEDKRKELDEQLASLTI